MKLGTVEPKWTCSISLTGYRLTPGVGWCWILSDVPEELTAILREIEKALDAKLYYLAIAVALSVPDICACLEFDPDNPTRATMKTYSTWCNTNIGSKFDNLNGDDLFYLRCGILHRGNFDNGKSKFNRVLFLCPESVIKAHDAVFTVEPGVKIGGKDAEELRLSGKILHLDVVRFCNSIMDAARAWSVSKSDDPNVQRNLPNLIRYRPDGLPPFSVGVPTIG
jgi:hypothetical protein